MDTQYSAPKPSQMNAREFVERIDELIRYRLRKEVGPTQFPDAGNEHTELLKRELTDYLLAADARGGLYAKGPHE